MPDDSMVLQHYDKVRYVGPTDRSMRVVHGATYHCCGCYPQPKCGPEDTRGDEIGIYVDDPFDDFGGVISLSAKLFSPITE